MSTATETSPLLAPANIHTKADRVEYVRQQLRTNAKWAQRALLVIHAQQTVEEQIAERTTKANGYGFGANDAEILTSFAKQVLTWKAEVIHKYPAALSPRQNALLFKRIGKYARQLIELYPKIELEYPLQPRPKAALTASAPASIAI